MQQNEVLYFMSGSILTINVLYTFVLFFFFGFRFIIKRWHLVKYICIYETETNTYKYFQSIHNKAKFTIHNVDFIQYVLEIKSWQHHLQVPLWCLQPLILVLHTAAMHSR